MKKLFVFALSIAMTAGIAVAQQDAAAGSTASQPTAQQQTTVGQPTDTNEPLYTGCLTGTKDNYLLTGEKGDKYRLHSDKDINEHVNTMVEVRGTVKTEGVDSQKTAASDNAKDLDVADIKTVSKGCSAGAVEQK
jgi:hypothetical protein